VNGQNLIIIGEKIQDLISLDVTARMKRKEKIILQKIFPQI